MCRERDKEYAILARKSGVSIIKKKKQFIKKRKNIYENIVFVIHIYILG